MKAGMNHAELPLRDSSDPSLQREGLWIRASGVSHWNSDVSSYLRSRYKAPRLCMNLASFSMPFFLVSVIISLSILSPPRYFFRTGTVRVLGNDLFPGIAALLLGCSFRRCRH